METPTVTVQQLLERVNELAPEAVSLARSQLAAEAWQEVAMKLQQRVDQLEADEDGGTES